MRGLVLMILYCSILRPPWADIEVWKFAPIWSPLTAIIYYLHATLGSMSDARIKNVVVTRDSTNKNLRFSCHHRIVINSNNWYWSRFSAHIWPDNRMRYYVYRRFVFETWNILGIIGDNFKVAPAFNSKSWCSTRVFPFDDKNEALFMNTSFSLNIGGLMRTQITHRNPSPFHPNGVFSGSSGNACGPSGPSSSNQSECEKNRSKDADRELTFGRVSNSNLLIEITRVAIWTILLAVPCLISALWSLFRFIYRIAYRRWRICGFAMRLVGALTSAGWIVFGNVLYPWGLG